MNATARSTFLSRVAAAVRAGNRFREASRRELPPSTGYVAAGPDSVARLIEELEKVGARARRVGSAAEAQAAVRDLVRQFEIRRAVRTPAAILDELGIGDALRESGVELISFAELAALGEDARRDRVFAADLGVTAPDWAIAETGSLVYASGPEQSRSATLLPPVHLTVVDRSRVLSDLFDLPAQLVEQFSDGLPSRNVAIVTGPSKTGDIELRLTTGVHGPGEVHVLIRE